MEQTAHTLCSNCRLPTPNSHHELVVEVGEVVVVVVDEEVAVEADEDVDEVVAVVATNHVEGVAVAVVAVAAVANSMVAKVCHVHTMDHSAMVCPMANAAPTSYPQEC